jgi:hypothetical protein
MNTQIQKNIQRVLITATGLVILGAALNVFVMQTLGSFDAASVILALYVAAWAFVLGDIGLILSALWFFMKRRVGLAERRSVQPEAREHAFVPVESARLSKPCHAC